MSDFELGLIEGFYGRLWTWEQRRSMAHFLRDSAYRNYIYAPKGDSALRGQWREAFSAEWMAEVGAWAGHCREIGLKWGLGLSPMGLQAAYGEADRRTLVAKLDEINSLAPDSLWLLFDDMRGDQPNLAANQCAVTADVRRYFGGQLAICPSYYSFDPILDKVFGQRPPRYLEELGEGLPTEVQILWTGDKVMSGSQNVGSCERFRELTGRKPLLWDNYPVNDGNNTADFLHLDAFRRRPAELAEVATGHYANPMVQCELSKLPLSTLPQCYHPRYDADRAREQSLASLPAALAGLLRQDWPQFQQRGLGSLQPPDQDYWRRRYTGIDHPAAAELRDWLAGGYAFDPACLTG